MPNAVWAGALSGVAIAITIGVIIIIVFYTASDSVFNGDGKLIFESFLFLVASYFITVMAFAMFKFKNYEAKWEMKLAAGNHHQVGHITYIVLAAAGKSACQCGIIWGVELNQQSIQSLHGLTDYSSFLLGPLSTPPSLRLNKAMALQEKYTSSMTTDGD